MAYSKQGSTAKWDQEEHSVHQGRSSMVESGIWGVFYAVKDAAFTQYASVAFHVPWMRGNGLQIRISRLLGCQ